MIKTIWLPRGSKSRFAEPVSAEGRPIEGYDLGYGKSIVVRNLYHLAVISLQFESDRAHQPFIRGRLGLSAGVR